MFHCDNVLFFVFHQFPLEESTEAEEDVMEFCKVTADINPLPVVQLDV